VVGESGQPVFIDEALIAVDTAAFVAKRLL
jgi:hypothetical protein